MYVFVLEPQSVNPEIRSMAEVNQMLGDIILCDTSIEPQHRAASIPVGDKNCTEGTVMRFASWPTQSERVVGGIL